MSSSSILIRGAKGILTGLAGDAMRHDVATQGADIRVTGSTITAIRIA